MSIRFQALPVLLLASACHSGLSDDSLPTDTETVADTETSPDTDTVADTDDTGTVWAMVDPCAYAGPGELDAATDLLADATRYTAPFALTVNSDGSVTWSNESGDTNYASVRNSDWTVAPGQTYILRATFELSPSTRAYVAVDTFADGTPKDIFGDPTVATQFFAPWGVSRMRDAATDDAHPQEVCLAFTPAAGETLADLRIGGFGMDENGAPTGPVTLRDVRADRMAPIGTFVRFAVAGAPSALTVSMVGRYPNYTDRNPTFPVTVPADGSFSEWVDATHFSPGDPIASWGFGTTAYYGLSFLDDSGAPVTGAALSVEIATSPDAAPYYRSQPWPLAAPVLLYLPDETADLGARPQMVGLLADQFQRQLDDFETRHPPGTYRVPERYVVSSDIAPAATVDGPTLVDTAVRLFHDAGFNGIWSTGVDIVDIDERSLAAGIVNHSASIDSGQINPYYYGTADFDRDAMYADAVAIDESLNFKGQLAPFGADHVLLFMFDELYGPWLHPGPLVQDAFCDYLVDHGQADLIASGCDTVPPIVGPPLWDLTSARPVDPSADPDAARLWYWKVRFHNWAGAEIFRQGRLAMHGVTGVAYPITINAGQPASPSYGYAAGVETRELLDHDGEPVIDVLWGEEFSLGRCGAEDNSVNADFWAAETRSTSLPFGSYTHANDGFMPQKVLSSAVRGGRYYDPWSFPMVIGGDNALQAEQWMDQAAAANDLLARVEPFLYDGQRPDAEVGILVGTTDALWNYDDYSQDCPGCTLTIADLGMHYLLTHAHYPVDFVMEADLGDLVDGQCAAGSVLDGKRVLFLNRRYLSNCAFATLQAWVEAGGILVAGKELPLYDEYGQLVDARADWFEVGLTPVTGTVAGEVQWGTNAIVEPAGYDVAGLTLPSSGVTAVATYTTGSAAGQVAAADVVRGNGLVRMVGFSAGTWYFQPVFTCGYPAYFPSFLTPSMDQRPAGFDDALRGAVTEVLGNAGLDEHRPVVPSDPRVEGQLVLDRDAGGVTGGAIVLMNYRNDAPTPITVEVPSLSGCVTSALTGQQYTIVGHALALQLADDEVLGFSTTDANCSATFLE